MERNAKLLLALVVLILFSPFGAAQPVSLDGPWKLQAGDDPTWSSPGYDDSAWQPVEVPRSWRKGGYPAKGQMAWYRKTVDLSALNISAGGLGLRMGTVRNAYQLFVNGKYVGGVGEMPPHARVNYDRVRIFPIDADLIGGDKRLTLAIRVWGGSDLAVDAAGGGLYGGPVLLGNYGELIRGLDDEQTPKLIFASLFLASGLYFLYLWLRNRALVPFFWFAVSSLILAPYIVTQSQWKYVLGVPFVIMEKIESCTLFVFLALIIELVWSVLGRPVHLWVRVYQAYFISLAVLLIAFPGLDIHYYIRPYWQLGALVSVVPIFFTLVREIFRGNRDAYILSIGVAIFTVMAVNDLLFNMQFIDTVRLIPLGFLAILAAMGVSLANRLSEFLGNLEQQVRERTAEITEVNEQLADANRQLTELTRIDPLTGLLNRRGFEDEAETERQRFVRRKEPLGLLLVDIDFFKQFNDRYGHACGDFVLVRVAQLMKEQLRDVDRVARWGGEEFILLLPSTNAEGLANIGEKLRASIADARFDYEGEALNVTATFGGAQYMDGETMDQCIDRADAALYKGKSEGRNRVILAVP